MLILNELADIVIDFFKHHYNKFQILTIKTFGLFIYIT